MEPSTTKALIVAGAMLLVGVGRALFTMRAKRNTRARDDDASS